VKASGRWAILYRAIDQHRQVIDVLLPQRRDLSAAKAFFVRALAVGITPAEVTTDRAPVYPRVLDEHLSGRCTWSGLFASCSAHHRLRIAFDALAATV
jgi:transposase-like protein